MIERIVLLQMTEEFSSKSALAEVAERSREVLPKLPGVLACHVGLAADDRTRENWHVALVVCFASVDDIPSYAGHPDHREYVDTFLRPRLASIVAHNFEVKSQ